MKMIELSEAGYQVHREAVRFLFLRIAETKGKNVVEKLGEMFIESLDSRPKDREKT